MSGIQEEKLILIAIPSNYQKKLFSCSKFLCATNLISIFIIQALKQIEVPQKSMKIKLSLTVPFGIKL